MAKKATPGKFRFTAGNKTVVKHICKSQAHKLRCMMITRIKLTKLKRFFFPNGQL